MKRIYGIPLKPKKDIFIALTAVFGIGTNLAKYICKECNIHIQKKVEDITAEEINMINLFIKDNFIVEGELKKEIKNNVKNLIEISNYRGKRHVKQLPTRGQRTRTNGKTIKKLKHF